jgi:hypothetical protein
MQNKTPNCARCPYEASVRLCQKEDGKSPDFCPTQNMMDLAEQSLQRIGKGQAKNRQGTGE